MCAICVTPATEDWVLHVTEISCKNNEKKRKKNPVRKTVLKALHSFDLTLLKF